ncbi:MAG: hypothetical protein SCALA702_32080 [Melioribacteraceae bacterium]|nr:MAG: hypothetical protein SCALA702_32080 [Melioribacteraceae bacterium]
MKRFLLFLILFSSTFISAQSASNYFPANPGFKWYYEITPLDSLNNPVYSLTSVKADTFVAEGIFQGEESNLILSKYGSYNTIGALPWIDSNYIKFDDDIASVFYGLQNFVIPGDTGTFPGFANWIDFYDFGSPAGFEYDIFVFDTTLAFNGQEFPLRFKLSGKRLNDELISTELGDFNCKKFEIKTGIYFLIEIPPFPALEIEIVAITNSVWIAPDNWIVKEYQPSELFDISEYVPIPPFVIPGTIKNIIPEVSQESVTINVNNGWNLVSPPLQMQDMSVTNIFPDATSDAFGFDAGYIQVENLASGSGYWLKFDDQFQYEISGDVPTSNIELAEGWNIIGIYNNEVSVSQITTEPEGILQSNFFSFENGYINSDLLIPGKGYWIKTSGAGELIINGVTASKEELNSSTLEPIIITDANGYKFTLYTSEQAVNKNELPPLPPNGVADVRYSDNTYITNVNNTILFQALEFPVTVEMQNDKYILTVNGEKAGSKIILSSSSELPGVESLSTPVSYGLTQNYPNPFNPSTKISFSIASREKVTITVFDVLGNNIENLVNTVYDPGTYTVSFDGSGLSSGIYFYKISAGAFNSVKKMMLLK